MKELCWILFLASISGHAVNSQVLRLPNSIKPVHYDLCVHTELDPIFTFQGRVEIELECLEETSVITLHCKELNITSIFVISADYRALEVTSFTQGDQDFLYIQVGEQLVVDSYYRLVIDYHGNLTDSPVGYYRGSYTDSTTGITRWWAGTQFEPIDARRAYPCFDEPAMKATFSVSLSHRDNYTSVSNMPELYRRPHVTREGWVETVFMKSKVMSTYLVAFVVSDYIYKEIAVDAETNLNARVWAHTDVIDEVDWVLDLSPKIINSLVEYLQVPFPLPKVDISSVSSLIRPGMENWGLITLREPTCLYQEEYNTFVYQWLIANTETHELSHFYFGNLVTMSWWPDTWLHEGFAQYFASFIIDSILPGWNDVTYSITWIQEAREIEGQSNAPKLMKELNNEADYDTLFDETPYYKGFLIVYFMHNFLGDAVFRSGLTRYLERFAYSNADSDDLFSCLTESAEGRGVLPDGVTVSDVMHPWLYLEGIPVINVTRQGNGQITVSQERYFSRPNDKFINDSYLWWIPLTYLSASQTFNMEQQQHQPTTTVNWLRGDESETTIDTGLEEMDWIMFNVENAAYCRTNYDVNSWTLLIELLESDGFKVIPERNRHALILDSFQLASAEYLDYNIPFKLIRYIKKDRTFPPWSAALYSMRCLDKQLQSSGKVYPTLKAFYLNLLQEIYEHFGPITDVPDTLEMIRSKYRIFRAAVTYGLEDCVTKALQIFNTWMQAGVDYKGVPTHFRAVICQAGVQYGGEEEWNFVYQLFENGQTEDLKYEYSDSLYWTPDNATLLRLLEDTMDTTKNINSYAFSMFFNALKASRHNFEVCLGFVEENAQLIQNSTSALELYITSILDYATRTEDLDRVNKILEDNSALVTIDDAINHSYKGANFNIEFLLKHEDEIYNILGEM